MDVTFQVGDIIVDTQYDDMFGIGGGHVMLVIKVDEEKDRVVITHAGFNYFPETVVFSGYESFVDTDPKRKDKRYLIRWIGPNREQIAEKIREVVQFLYTLRGEGLEMSFFYGRGLAMAWKRACFQQENKLLEKGQPITIDVMRKFVEDKWFVCSTYIMMVWKIVLEHFGLDDAALTIDPFECLPKDLLTLPERFPNYWEKIPYYSVKKPLKPSEGEVSVPWYKKAFKMGRKVSRKVSRKSRKVSRKKVKTSRKKVKKSKRKVRKSIKPK